MKKILLSIGLICAGTLSFSQSGVTNLSFEAWATVAGSPTPTGFNSLGVSQITVGAQNLNSYARVVSNGLAQSNPASTGAMELGALVGFNPVDGAPYALKPIAMTGYYKCSLVGIDSVYISVDFTKSHNSLLSQTVANYVEITTSTNSWTSFSISLTYTGALNPDSAHIYVTSNRSWSGNSTLGQSGTTLDVDNFVLLTPSNIRSFEDYSVLLSAYPNPATENFNIISKTANASKIDVYDLNGRLIESKKFETDKVSFNLNSYAPGLYFYKIVDTENTVIETQKFTVIK